MMAGNRAQQHLPPRRVLVALALAVLALHLLALKLAPLKLGMQAAPEPLATRAFITRTITPTLAPPAPPAPAAVVAKAPKPAPLPKPAPAARPKPVAEPERPVAEVQAVPASDFKQNEPLAQVLSAPDATQSIASVDSRSAAAIDSAAPADGKSAEPSPLTPAMPATAAAPATPDALPPSVITATSFADSVLLGYKMTGSSKGLTYHAHADLSWRNLGGEYEAGVKVSAFILGSRTMSSRGQITPSGLAPVRFSDKTRSEHAAHFDAAKGKVTFSANTPDAPLLPGAQDRVSVFFQLSGILAAGPGNQTGSIALPLGTSITIYTVGPREADTWTFVVESEELLMLPAGEMAALKLTRVPRRQYDQKVEIWYAPSLAYLPVRSRVTQANGDFIDQQLESAERL